MQQNVWCSKEKMENTELGAGGSKKDAEREIATLRMDTERRQTMI